MSRKFIGLTLLAISTLLSGCASNQPMEVDKKAVTEPLEEGVKAIAESLRILRELQNAKQFASMSEEERERTRAKSIYIPESLNIPITLTHHGDAEELIRTIGRLTRYRVAEPIGRVPHDKPIVMITARARPAGDILRDVGAQTGQRLHIKVIPAERPTDDFRGVIELEYTGR